MVMSHACRRRFLLSLAAAVALPPAAGAETVIDLEWEDLLPESDNALPRALRGIVEHDASDLASQQPVSSGVRTDWNGKVVRIPGFIVPIDFDGSGVVAFILVPYVGACVHVPPPPANQLVLVTTDKPYETEGMFEPVTVTGMFGAASTSTQLAEVGYALSADRIEPYRW